MATSTVPLALAIMAHRQTRQANASGAGIAVFTPDLSELLWTNSRGAAFLQVDVPGPRLADAPPPTSAAVRQLRASARMFAAGATTARLRSPGGALLDASLARIDLDPHGAFALVIVPALAAEAETAAATARRLLAEAGMPHAEIRLRDGTRIAGEESPQVDVDDATIAAFLASDETVRVDEGGSLVLARLTDEHVLLHEAERPPASVAPEADASASPADMPDAATPVSEPAGPDRRKTGMSALLTRWYARHPASESPVEAANQSAPQPTADAPDGSAAPVTDADAGEPQDVTMPDTAPAQNDAATASDDQPTTRAAEPPLPARLRPLRSAWGPAVTLATPDEPAATDAPEPDDALPTASAAADAVPESSADGEPGPSEGAVADEAVPAEPDPETETDGDEQPVAAGAGDLEPSFPEEAAEEAEEEADEADAPELRGQGPGAPFEPRFDIAAVRFVWRIDSDGRFRSLSPEFAAAVGPHSADVIDRSFADVARAYGLDPDGEVGQLLERRDTWSGRVIHWPVESSDRKAPVDLAALPVYARDRSFDGFRGFGVVRLAESVADPERLGLALAGVTAPDEGAETDRPEPAGDMAVPLQDGSVSFGRRTAAERRREGETVPKVIRLEERRRPRDGALSQSEEEAFRRIGQTLSDEETPHGLEQAVRLAAQRIEAFEDEDTEAQTPVEAPARDDAAADIPADEPEAESPEADGTPEAERAPAAPASDEGLVQALATVYAHLPLPVLVQVRETLAYGNREFLDLTGYADVEALMAEGGLAHLFADRDDKSAVAGELTIRRATGETIAVRTHMQRTTIAGRSCLVMSFFASPGASVAAMRGEAVREAPADDAEVKRLRHEVEELSTVLDTATDGVVFIDSAGNIRSMNGSAHALFGIGEDDSAGRPFVTLFAHESQKATMEYLESLREGGASAIVNEGREVIGRVAQGGFIPLSITLGPLPDDRGWCAVIRDIAHWKRVEEELTSARRQAEAASVQKSQFLTNVSHELRTPLNAIIGFADVMATECFGPIGNDRYLEYLEDIKRSGHHVLDLVNDLLDISKIEAGKLDLSFEAVSLNAVMAEVVALMQPQANRERVLVRSNLPSSVPPVVADHRSIRQIAMNLVSNAIRFTPPGGQIIVSTSYVAEGDVALRFRDSGIGMTEHEIEIAMLPFQQVNPTSRRRGEGTGLGLPLTKAMAEANRANFSISSTPGEGTLVEILFPRQRVLAS